MGTISSMSRANSSGTRLARTQRARGCPAGAAVSGRLRAQPEFWNSSMTYLPLSTGVDKGLCCGLGGGRLPGRGLGMTGLLH